MERTDMAVVPLPQLGGCLCGVVRYSLNAAPLLAYACHCRDCQSRSGTAYTLTLVIQQADISFTGTLDKLRRPMRSGREIEHSSCPECRVPLVAWASVTPEYMSLRAGTLDDASWVVPIAQTFAESAIPWALIPEVRSVPWDEFDYVALGREWVVSAPKFAASC